MEKTTLIYISLIVGLMFIIFILFGALLFDYKRVETCSKDLNNLCNTTNELISLNNMQTKFINDKLDLNVSFINYLTCEVFK